MDDDLRFGFEFLERGHAADVVHVRVRAGDRLQFETMPVDRCDNISGSITGIDADRAPGFLAANDARVLLESSDGNFFDNHFLSRVNSIDSPGAIVARACSISGSNSTTVGTSLAGMMIAETSRFLRFC